MEIRHLFIVIAIACGLTANAQAQTPTIAPSASFTDAEGNESQEQQFSGSAPIKAVFKANPKDADTWTAHYEWRFYTEGKADSPYLIRYDENTEFTFTTSGISYVVCYATFTKGNDVVAYIEDFWRDMPPFSVSISESKLDFPNAFSPNGDGINDVYKAKEGYQSIVEFHATIFNRWGQKLYEWNNPAGGWDGKSQGKDAKDGVYFVVVKAKGADGRKFNIKKDVNLLRKYTETTNF